MRGRDQAAVFYRLKKPVENMSNRCVLHGLAETFNSTNISLSRTFTMSHLEKILAVFPDAYRVMPVKEVLTDGERVDSVSVEMLDVFDKKTQEGEFFTPWGDQLRQRREEFHKRLVERVKVEHRVC
jgi:hypothetical protein